MVPSGGSKIKPNVARPLRHRLCRARQPGPVRERPPVAKFTHCCRAAGASRSLVTPDASGGAFSTEPGLRGLRSTRRRAHAVSSDRHGKRTGIAGTSDLPHAAPRKRQAQTRVTTLLTGDLRTSAYVFELVEVALRALDLVTVRIKIHDPLETLQGPAVLLALKQDYARKQQRLGG